MKKMFVLLIALLAMNGASAQSCLPQGITFSTQAQINNFHTSYPGCTQIEGDVTICGYTITNLNGLSVITAIGGSLNIECNEVLASLAGLNNLDFIGGNLYAAGNIILTSMSGLQNLTSIGGDLQVTNNIALTSLAGLEGLNSIGGMLWINDNTLLTSLAGLNNLVSISETVRIFSNSSLLNLQGLESLTSIGGALVIGGMNHLGGLGNPYLASIMSLGNVTSVGGDINIGYNDALTSLDGLDNIDAGSIMDLSVYKNVSLSDCEVASICEYLASPGGTILIYDNAPGCNSLQEVEDGCLLIAVSQPLDAKEFTLYPNPVSDLLMIETPSPRDKYRLHVTDPGGRELLLYDITGQGSQISPAGLPSGVYFIRITDGKNSVTKKVVKQ